MGKSGGWVWVELVVAVDQRSVFQIVGPQRVSERDDGLSIPVTSMTRGKDGT